MDKIAQANVLTCHAHRTQTNFAMATAPVHVQLVKQDRQTTAEIRWVSVCCAPFLFVSVFRLRRLQKLVGNKENCRKDCGNAVVSWNMQGTNCTRDEFSLITESEKSTSWRVLGLLVSVMFCCSCCYWWRPKLADWSVNQKCFIQDKKICQDNVENDQPNFI